MFEPSDLSNYTFDLNQKSALLTALMESAGFKNSAETTAVISLGGTMSSYYSVESESIAATSQNKVIGIAELYKNAWGVLNQPFTGISLFAKDSRDVTPDDIKLLLDFINVIENRKIIVTCGTYGLPAFAETADAHVQGNKVVGFTGSMLTEAHAWNDVSANAIGVITAVEQADLLRQQAGITSPYVFAAFHGAIISGKGLKTLDLHPPDKKGTILIGSQPRIERRDLTL